MATLIAVPMGGRSVPGLASGEGECDKDRTQIIQVVAKAVQQTSLNLRQTSFGEGDRIVFQHVCSDRRVANRSSPYHCLWSRLQTRLSGANK